LARRRGAKGESEPKISANVMRLTVARRGNRHLLVNERLRGSLTMSHRDLTRWIEDAEARRAAETAALDQNWRPADTHYRHLGEVIARVLPSWAPLSVSRASLALIGCHALAYVRHPMSHTHH
jgi:hypothetical protein